MNLGHGYGHKPPPQTQSFVIQIRGDHSEHQVVLPQPAASSRDVSPLPPPPPPPHHHHQSELIKFSAMKIFHRFRKIIMRFIFSVPSSSTTTSSSTAAPAAMSAPRRRSCDHGRMSGYQSPKISCSSSSYHSANSHYSEAIADCIEFLNNGRKSDVVTFLFDLIQKQLFGVGFGLEAET
ncbi:hypothetical protein Ancab_016729 [Ancistrocladus abbreviatus]